MIQSESIQRCDRSRRRVSVTASPKVRGSVSKSILTVKSPKFSFFSLRPGAPPQQWLNITYLYDPDKFLVSINRSAGESESLQSSSSQVGERLGLRDSLLEHVLWVLTQVSIQRFACRTVSFVKVSSAVERVILRVSKSVAQIS